MAFREIQDLNPGVTISLGGENKKTRVQNPTSIEGYYLGVRATPDNKKKSGVSYLYVLQTAKGNIGVWGRTDLDKKMPGAVVGRMMRISVTGTRPTPNGDMYIYKLEDDPDNTVDVVPSSSTSFEDSEQTSDDSDFEKADEDTADDDEVSQAHLAAATIRKEKIQALLKNKKV